MIDNRQQAEAAQPLCEYHLTAVHGANGRAGLGRDVVALPAQATLCPGLAEFVGQLAAAGPGQVALAGGELLPVELGGLLGQGRQQLLQAVTVGF